MNGRDVNPGQDLRQRIHLLQVSLKRIGAGNPRLEAELLICAALGWNRVELLSRPEESFTAEQERRIEELLDRRLCGEPIAYVLGNADFMGLRLEVGPGVLIPRSETELLVEKIEDGQIPLQDSIDQYEQGMALINHCRGILQQAEKRIETISKEQVEADTEEEQ